MKRLPVFPVVCAIMALSLLCSKTPSVRMQADFTTRAAWNYSLDIRVSGKAEQWDTVRNFTSIANGMLTGTSGDNGATLRFSIVDPQIQSDVLPAAEVEHLRRGIAGAAMVLSLNNGAVTVADTTAIPAVYLSGWDIYRALARVIPSVPDRAISPGYTWDRTRMVPLATTMGVATAHLYQAFTFDSCTVSKNGNTMAHVSWRFTYRVEKPAHDTAGGASAIPLSGSGNGYALFDVPGKFLARAQMSFTVPPQGTGLEWTEEVTLQLSD